MTRCPAPPLIQSALQFAQEAVENVIFDYDNRPGRELHRDDLIGDKERGEILRALSDHIVACEVIASTLRKETAVP